MNGISSQFQLLHNAIEFANQNHHVISQNIANVNTPNYQARQLSFQQFVAQAEKIENNQVPVGSSVEFEIHYANGLEIRTDGNNVDLDTELAQMKKNDLVHQTLTQLLGAKMGMMKTAIKG